MHKVELSNIDGAPHTPVWRRILSTKNLHVKLGITTQKYLGVDRLDGCGATVD